MLIFKPDKKCHSYPPALNNIYIWMIFTFIILSFDHQSCIVVPPAHAIIWSDFGVSGPGFPGLVGTLLKVACYKWMHEAAFNWGHDGH